jgi:hypothetical protein
MRLIRNINAIESYSQWKVKPGVADELKRASDLAYRMAAE